MISAITREPIAICHHGAKIQLCVVTGPAVILRNGR